MLVRDLMTRGVQCVSPGESIAGAAEKMKRLNVGSLPICGEDDKLAGMITDRDITVRATAECCEPRSTTVGQVMTPGVVYCFDDQPVDEVARLMEKHQVRRLPVIDREQRLVGIVSLGDLAVKNQDDRLSGEALERISEPALPLR